MATYAAAMSGVITNLLPAGTTTGTGSSLVIPARFGRHTFFIDGSSGVSAGAVQIETADDPGYSGTWAPLSASPTTVVASSEVILQIIGVLLAVRARVSTNISGGTVTVNYLGCQTD